MTAPKEQRIQETMERQNEIAQVIARQMPSIDHDRWGNTRRDPVFHKWVGKAFPESNGLRSHDANQVAYKVSENFQSWKTNGYRGNPPQYENVTWARFCNCNNVIRYECDSGRWSVRLPLEPYNSEWFWLWTGPFQEQFLDGHADGEMNFGDAELKQYGDRYVLNQAVTLPDTGETDYTPETAVGVDMNLTNLAALAVYGDDIEQVELFSGDKIGHHRRRLRQMRSDLQQSGNQAKIEELKGLERRFCEQENHRISKRIVEIAEEYDKPVIVMEQLKGIRKRINEQKRSSEFTAALNSWTFGELRSMIEYKAAKAGIKTKTVGAAYTSKSCNRCGESGTRPYKGNWSRFYCRNCDYEVNADVNAAINIAERSRA